jgi:phospholipid/cholesterol/gamma-HCH transport system substrate-binding protein
MHNKVQPIHVVQVLAFMAAAILIGLTLVRGIGKFPLLDEGYTVKANFDDLLLMPKDAPVKVDDLNVGRVTKIDIDKSTGQASVELLLREEAPPIYDDASIQIRTLSILGLRYVALNPGTGGPGRTPIEDLPDEFTIPADHTRGQANLEVLNQAVGTQFKDKAARLLDNVNEGLSGIEPKIHDSFATTNVWSGSLSETLRDRDAQTRRLLQNSARFFRTLGDRRKELGSIIDSGESLTRELNSQRAELNRFLDTFPDFGAMLARQSERILNFSVQGSRTLRRLNDLDPEIVRILESANGLFGQISSTNDQLQSMLAVANPTLDTVIENRIGLDRFNKTFPTFMKGSIQTSSNYPRQTTVQIVNAEDAIASLLLQLQHASDDLPPLPGLPTADADELEKALVKMLGNPRGQAALARARAAEAGRPVGGDQP